MTTVAIIQSSYIPWKGYFDIVADADVFVFLDDVQYTPRDWRNRNKLKGERGAFWVTVPVVAPDRETLIHDVGIADDHWARQHWKTLETYYRKAPHFARYEPFLRDAFLAREWRSLSALNQYLTTAIARDMLGLATRFVDSRALAPEGQKQARLLDILTKLGATRYVSGPSARAYIDPAGFEAAGIELVFKSYKGYPEYPQFFPPFEHAVSILDMLMHTGPDAPWYMRGWREGPLTRVVPADQSGTVEASTTRSAGAPAGPP